MIGDHRMLGRAAILDQVSTSLLSLLIPIQALSNAKNQPW